MGDDMIGEASSAPASPPVGTSLVPTADPGLPLVRDSKGRFLTGNSGGGRPRGARNRLSEGFVAAVAEDFAEHGATALASLRAVDPGRLPSPDSVVRAARDRTR